MTLTTVVRVTADHIKYGEVQDCEKCPIALAVLDAISNPAQVDVNQDIITLWLPGATWVADPPHVAKSFIEDFDNCATVAPFDFTLTWRVAEDPEPLS
jgi:hypothetical protein